MQTRDIEMVIKIRVFEEYILELFGMNKLSGTTHTYIGQEATAVALMKYVREEDKVFSNHRCHGHYLAYGGPERLLLAEIMSRESGLCQGRGGSQHIHYKNFYTNGIQGGIVPDAVGVALSDKLRGSTAKTIVFLGDGTLGQGVVYESANIAAVYNIPVVFVIEDNGYAMSTRRDAAISGDIRDRMSGFGIKTFDVSDTDVDVLTDFFGDVFSYIDDTGKPVCAVVHNYRLAAHSKGDDLRPAEEIERMRKKDPYELIKASIGEEEVSRIYSSYRDTFEMYEKELEEEPVYKVVPPTFSVIPAKEAFLSHDKCKYVERIRKAFHAALGEDDRVCFLGEDIRDPYGGPFKATKGLTQDFDNRILNMPISEAAMTGIAVGMAMNASRPVVEMMFGDFVTLAFDQLLNHAAKYPWVYGDGLTVPMVLRVPSGAGRGYGPTHSQSLEKYLVGIPGIRVLALSAIADPVAVYGTIFKYCSEPTVVIENKKLYGQDIWTLSDGRYGDFSVREINNYGFPTFVFSFDEQADADAVIITYGGMLEEALEAADELMMKDEILVNVVALTQLSPIPVEDIKKITQNTDKICVVEEGCGTCGIGAEIVASCAEAGIGKDYIRISAPDMPIPNGIVLEKQIMPNAEIIAEKIRR